MPMFDGLKGDNANLEDTPIVEESFAVTPSRKRPLLENRRPAVVMEPDERKVHALVQHLQLIRSEKIKKRKLKEEKKRKEHEAEKAKDEELSRKRRREERRERYREQDKLQKKIRRNV
nr:hypothetical protein CFP56_41607 [Quercus suber]